MITVGYLKEILEDEEIAEEFGNPNDIEVFYFDGGPMSDISTVSEIEIENEKLVANRMTDISWDDEGMDPDEYWDNTSSITIEDILKLYKDKPDDTKIEINGKSITEQGDIHGNDGKLLII